MALDHKPRKRFGQNFLHDPGVIDRIIKLVGPEKAEHLVEIGPGLGALTYPMADHGFTRLDLVELDRDLVAKLEAFFDKDERVTVYSEDALNFEFSSLSDHSNSLYIYGNLPYNISTPLLFHLFNYLPHIASMTFMLQKEVVDRLAANPNTSEYGRLSVMAQWHCQVIKGFKVPPGAFNPPPKVDSALVTLIPHKAPIADLHDLTKLSEVVRLAFGQRRKTLRNSLKNLISSDKMINSGIEPTLRPDRLSVPDFVTLANLLT